MRVRSIALFLTDVGMSKLIFHASFKSTSVPSFIICIYIYCVCKRIDTTAYTPSKSFIWFHFSFIVVINILNDSQATASGNEDDVNACNVCYQLLLFILYECANRSTNSFTTIDNAAIWNCCRFTTGEILIVL